MRHRDGFRPPQRGKRSDVTGDAPKQRCGSQCWSCSLALGADCQWRAPVVGLQSSIWAAAHDLLASILQP